MEFDESLYNEVSLISMHPFFREFAFAVVKTLRGEEFIRKERVLVDSDLVPRVSEETLRIAGVSDSTERKIDVDNLDVKPSVGGIDVGNMRSSVDVRDMVERKVAPVRVEPVVHVEPVRDVEPVSDVRFDESELDKPIRMKSVRAMPSLDRVEPVFRPRPVFQQRSFVGQPVVEEESGVGIIAPVKHVEGAVDAEGKYGKISLLLNDPSVSTIECLGPDKELMIVRAGQKQRTRIVLSVEEINEVLNVVADETHIPLIEGVFRASVGGFSINAVISEMIGSRFVIKKATAYGLLE